MAIPVEGERMSLPAGYARLIPIHQKILDRLIAQAKIDAYGAIGWGGPIAELGLAASEQDRGTIYQPLIERGLVCDCVDQMGSSGRFFVRVTVLGTTCAMLGIMPEQNRPVPVDQVRAAFGKVDAHG